MALRKLMLNASMSRNQRRRRPREISQRWTPMLHTRFCCQNNVDHLSRGHEVKVEVTIVFGTPFEFRIKPYHRFAEQRVHIVLIRAMSVKLHKEPVGSTDHLDASTQPQI